MFKMKMTRKIQAELTFAEENYQQRPCSGEDITRSPNRNSNTWLSPKNQRRGRFTNLTSLLTTLTLYCLSLSLVGAQDIQEWLQNTVQPQKTFVNSQEDLEFRLISKQFVKKDDCIIFDIQSPYRDDAPQTYQSFDTLTPYEQPCDFSSQHEAVCSVIGPQRFQVTFTQDTLNTSILGSTTGKPFRNPYSARRIDRVTTSMYVGCDKTIQPAVVGDVEMSYFQQRMIPDNKAAFTSSSDKIGVINAQLSVKFATTSGMQANGVVTISTPAWFAINKESAIKTYSSESMVDFASEASFESHASEGFEVISQTFDSTARSIVIQYSGTRQIRANEQVEFRITDFKNPVNKSFKAGFQISTSDSLGYMIDQSSNMLPLETRMVQPGNFNTKDMLMLGDPEGINVGRVGVYNKVQLFISTTIPLEQGCHFKFVFPKELPIDDKLSTIEGEGIFQPAVDRYKLSNNEFRVDVDTNTVFVSGCNIPDLLSSRPYGLIYFGYIKLPDYVTDTGSFEIYVYSDPFLQDLTFKETGREGNSTPLRMTTEMMKPGVINLTEFTPSNFYAYIADVEFTIGFVPTSASYPSTRIIIQMPETLTFDAEKGCSVTLAFAKCSVDSTTNIVTLTEIFKAQYSGGQEIKFTLKSATNPTGAREAGPWSIRTERPFEGKFYTVDEFKAETSFYALPGYIKSNLASEDQQTFVTNTKYDFKFETEHNVPPNGFLVVRLPDEMAFPEEVVDSQQLVFSVDARVQLDGETAPTTTQVLDLVSVTEREARFQLPEGHEISTNPIHLIVEGVRTPRSFRPSSQFTITSYTPDGLYIIDQGGQDIFVTMNKMSTLRGIQIQPQDLTNGDFVTYKVIIDSHLEVKDGDILYMTVPEECGISTDVTCEPFFDIESGAVDGISAVSCTQLDQNLIIIIEKVDKKDGQFSLMVNGIKNPPSFRRSGYFSKIYMTTSDYFKMQQVTDYMGLYVQTNKLGTITNYLRRQSTELYSGVGSYDITFRPYNRISANGVMTLEWSDQVVVFEETACQVETYTTFEDPLCEIDFAAKRIVIKNAFYVDQPYKNDVKITLSKVQNPSTNKDLQPFTIKTYEDNLFVYGIDQLIYEPLLQCLEPCLTCGAEKDYCLSCWPESAESYFMQTESFSTCREKCDDGYTTDGSERLWCTRCDEACATCADEGVQGDRYICETCSPAYSFYDPFNLKCLQECPVGTYETSGNLCQKCSDDCRSCSDKNVCTSCKQNSPIPFLLGDECLEACPKGFGSIAGVCLQCELPCAECSTGPQICTACDQRNGPSFLYGPNCISQCPQGFITNQSEMKCEGCAPGCFECDPNDQRICLKCDPQLMLLGDKCVSDCPPGYLSNYQADLCYSISSLDVAMVYFPFLILTGTFMILSLVGTKQKRKHLLIPNFLVLMGILEHAGLITQIILTYIYGTWRYMACVGAFWLFYVIGNIIFQVRFTKHVIGKDKLYIQWRERPANKWGRKMMQFMGIFFSWKAYKLTYSGFWGYKLNPVKFSDPDKFRSICRWLLYWNILTTYLGIFVLCFVGLVDLDFNTQLYIMMIENLAIAVIMTWAGLYEQSMMNRYLNNQGKFKSLSGSKGKFDVMSVLQDEPSMPDFNKTREALLNVKDIKTKNMFIERKQEELQEMFGPYRSCQSEVLDRALDEDPRRCHTWPAFNLNEDDYPINIKDPYPDQVYARGLTEEQMRQMKYLSKNAQDKPTQAGAYEADLNLRKDALLVGHQRELLEVEKSTKKGKARGRKNRYVKQIDHEDNDAGILLDDDAEGKARNEKAKNELLDKEASLEVARQKEERGLRKQEGKLRNQEAKERAMQLTEENLKLKRQLEEQRMRDAQESREFQKRIVEEEKRREAILAEIELKRRERELNRSKLEMEVNNAESMLKEVRSATPTAANTKLNADLPTRSKPEEIKERKSELKSERDEIKAPSKTATPKVTKEKQQSSSKPQKQLQLEKAQEVDKVRKSSARKSSNQSKSPLSSKRSSNSQVKESSRTTPPPVAVQQSQAQTTTAAPEPPIAPPNLQLKEQFESTQGDVYNRLYDFNEIDIAGDLDRDNKGTLIVPVNSKTGKKIGKDRSGLPINKFGYRIDPTSGDILFAKSGKVVFAKSELEESGNIPHPYSIEKFNFNPFELLGTFFYDDYEDPLSFQRGMRQGMTIDELGRQVSIQGFLCDSNGSLFDRHGNMRFDWRQFAPYGNLMPKLYNYAGRTFEIQEVMGIFDRDSEGNIQLLVGKDEQGSDVFVDKAGFTVNNRGYIVTREGNICTRQGKVLFLQNQLRDGEFPKIFPFSRFNISKVLGEFNSDPSGCPQLISSNESSGFVDNRGRAVNSKGYLVDKFENVVDQSNKVVFTKRLLDPSGDIPEIFRLNLLRSDSASSLSRLMSDLDREQRQQELQPTGHLLRKNDSNMPRPGAASDTSFESLMGDSPSKYDQQNQRFSLTSAPTADGNTQKGMKWNQRENDGIKEESDSDGEGRKGGVSRRKKKKKGQGFVVEDPTGRDIQLASAYGGVAKPRIRKTGQRFVVAANRLDRAGLMTSHVPSRPGNPRMQNLTGHRNSNFDTTGNASGQEGENPTTQLQNQQHQHQLVSTTISGKPSSSALKKRLGSSVQRRNTDNRDVEQTTNRTLNATAVTTQHNRSKIASRSGGMRGAGGATTLSSNLNNDQPTGSIESAIMEQDQQATVINEMRSKKLEARRKKNHTMQNEQKNKQKGSKQQQPNQHNMPKYDRAFEEEFEKLYKKDIDKFIDGSDFEVESLAGFSELSKGTFTSAVQNPRMKGLEKVYLQRLEFQNLGTKTQKSASRSRPKPRVKREFMDRFEDNPKFISKGENLKFEIGGAAHSGTGNSSEKKAGHLQQSHHHPYNNPKGSRSVLRDADANNAPGGMSLISASGEGVNQNSSANFRQQPFTPENNYRSAGVANATTGQQMYQQQQAQSTRDPYRQPEIRPFDSDHQSRQQQS